MREVLIKSLKGLFVKLSSEECHPSDRLDVSVISVTGPEVCLHSCGEEFAG